MTGGGDTGGGGGGSDACVIDASSNRTGTQVQVNLKSGCTTASEETFEAAATYWADFLYSPVKIEIDADFSPMDCTATGGILGGAGPTTYAAGPGLPENDMLYAIAHANALYGEDIYPDGPEMVMSFNSNIGTAGSIENFSWYFDDGSAPSTPAGTIDLYGTALHEIGHGLGFLSLLRENGSQAVTGRLTAMCTPIAFTARPWACLQGYRMRIGKMPSRVKQGSPAQLRAGRLMGSPQRCRKGPPVGMCEYMRPTL